MFHIVSYKIEGSGLGCVRRFDGAACTERGETRNQDRAAAQVPAPGPRVDARSTISYPRRRERLPPGVRRRSCASSRRAASSPAV